MSTKSKPSYVWEKSVLAEGFEQIDCPEYDPYKDFKRDPSGYYVLIRINFATIRIEVAICNKDRQIERVFIGRKCQDIYDAIATYEKRNNVKYFKESAHMGYLGKELKKAEIALWTGNNAYFQE